jgi:hypothetical protein
MKQLRNFGMLTFGIVLLLTATFKVSAADETKIISGKVYEFGEKDDYDLSSTSDNVNTYGNLIVNGEIYSSSLEDDYTIIDVKRDYSDETNDYNLSFSYVYDDKLLNAEDDTWHLVESSDKKIGNISLEEKIKNGAIVLQVSRDKTNWVTTFSQTNIFEDEVGGMHDFYTTTNVQLVNGCYYRVLVAYKTSIQTDTSKILLWNKNEYESKKNLEIYKFYIGNNDVINVTNSENEESYKIDSKKIRCEKFEGYYGNKTITNDDPHYGWDIGDFIVSGFTSKEQDADGNYIFLKNTGDQVVLWFNLKQDISALNGNDAITIEDDTAGSDQFFETPTIDFGKGALLIRKTNYENVQEPVQIYVNYLEANTAIGSNTKVDLFEEGDYEIALDYAIKYDKRKIFGTSVLPEESHYRIYFKFSVRNANSMFYPRDIVTTSELSNNSITPNGFYLDLANSKYLKLSIIREVLKDGAMGLTEDVRFNNVAKDGDQYTEEGIYTITVTNQYTGNSTTKKLYVGENNILKAYLTTGLSISEIQNKIAMGAIIDDSGNIINPDLEVEDEEISEDVTQAISENIVEYSTADDNEQGNSETETQIDVTNNLNPYNQLIPIIVCMAVTLVAVGYYVMYKKKNKKNTGGDE